MSKFRYDPAKAVSCLPEGEYEATIDKAEETTSKAGNDMVVLELLVYDGSRSYRLKEHIVEENLWKLKKIAKAVGSEEAFASGEFNPSDYVGRNLRVALTVKEDEKYGDQNQIKSCKPSGYSGELRTPPPAKSKPVAAGVAAESSGDDIPF